MGAGRLRESRAGGRARARALYSSGACFRQGVIIDGEGAAASPPGGRRQVPVRCGRYKGMDLHRWMFAALLASFSVAQAPAPSGPRAPSSTADRRAQDMRDQVSAGRVLKSHVKVRVRLQNGSRLTGVVKDSRLVERVDGLHFVRAGAEERGAGVRLYYTSGTRGFVFVPFDSLKSYEVLQRLSAQQVQQIEAEMQRAEQRAAERRARAAALAAAAPTPPAPAPSVVPAPAKPTQPLRNPPPGPGELAGWQPTRPAETSTPPETPASAGPPDGPAATDEGGEEEPKGAPEAAEVEEEAAPSEEQVRWSALLRTYPPKQGWNQTKRDEISRRFVVVGTQPSELEKAFVAQFDDWKKACAFFEVDPDAGVVPPPQTRRDQRRAERARTRPSRN